MARVDSRAAPLVDGALYLRFVPTLGYVQVLVVGEEDNWLVDPASIEVLRPQAVSIADLERGDPLIHEPRWRRIVDLDEARAEGLVESIRVRQGGSWDDMLASLDRIVEPLITAGWRKVDQHQEESWEFGDSVAYDLERSAKQIEVELYEDGSIMGWPMEPADEVDDPSAEPSEALFSLDGASEEATLAAFMQEGWLDQPS